MSAAEPMPHLPPELLDEAPPLTDDDLATYFDVMAMGPNAELRHDGTPDPELSSAVEVGAMVAGFRIDSDELAEWALRKALVANDQLGVLKDQRETWLAPIDGWYERTTKPLLKRLAWFTEQLEDYAVRRQQAGGAKTLELPSGTLKVTESKPKADVEDDASLARYLDDVLLSEPPRALDNDELARRQAWRERWDAIVAEAKDPVELVKRTPKVYVGPLRKLVVLAELPDGNELREAYSCGHWRTMSFSGEPDDVPGIGEAIECQQCEPDPIDGYPMVAVTEAEVTGRTRLAVLGPDGIELPGVTIDMGGLTPKVLGPNGKELGR